MLYKLSQLIFALLLFPLTIICASAQTNMPDASTRSGATDKEDFPKGIKETLAKSRIDREKKDYEELLQNGEEAVKLSESLEKTFCRIK